MDDDTLFKTPRIAAGSRIFGGFVCLFATLGGAAMLWTAHVVTFGEMNPEFMFESEPAEGNEYWRRKIFWSDMRGFLTIALPSLGIMILPWVHWFRSWKRSHGTGFDLCFAAVSTGAMLLPGYFLAQAVIAENFHPFLIVFGILFGGCLYAAAGALSRLASSRNSLSSARRRATDSDGVV